MVKNTTGGTKTKGLARKHINSANSGRTAAARLPENELEQIVYVNKMLGNGMCEVFNNDDIRLIAHIRNKFKGRHKRSNNITANSYILIGLRDWETPYKNCDVIFVYDDHHFNTIRNLPHLPILNIINRNNNYTTDHDDALFNDNDNDNDNDNHNDNHDDQHQHQHQHQHNHLTLTLPITHDYNDI